MSKIAVTGSSGLVGSNIIPILEKNHLIIPVRSSEGFDITRYESVKKLLSKIDPDIVLHLAAKANVDGCEEDFKQDSSNITPKVLENKDFFDDSVLTSSVWEGNYSAFGMNVVGAYNMAQFCKENKKKLIIISTDFVFDGKKDEYYEDDDPNPINWYGKTKWWGEIVCRTTLPELVIVRIAFPYGDILRRDFISKLVSIMKQRDEISLINDMVITPTYIEDIAKGLDIVIGHALTGTYHMTGASYTSIYEIGNLLKNKFDLSTKILPISGNEYFKDKAPRPFKLRIKHDKLSQLDYSPLTITEGIHKISK